MKYSVIVFACVLAVAAAQFNTGQYVPEKQNNFNNYNNRYNQYNNRYNQFNPYNRYQQNQNNAYRPFASSTLAPRPSFFFSSTPAPSIIAPARATISLIKPVQPAAPAPSVVAPAANVDPSAAPESSAAPSLAPAPVKPVISIAPVAPVVAGVPVSRYYSDAAGADIISYENEINPDGSFKYSFQTSNGIAAQEEGGPRSLYTGPDAVSAVVAQGSFAWISPEGQEIAITYTADEDGYKPSGPAIPQAPPIPELIARALEYIARTVPASAESTK